MDSEARHDTFLTFVELYDLQDGADNSELINEITGAASLLNEAFVDRIISGTNDLTSLLDQGTLKSYNAAELATNSYSKKAAAIAEGLGLFGKMGQIYSHLFQILCQYLISLTLLPIYHLTQVPEILAIMI